MNDELIRMDREYVTRDGREVRLLCIDRKSDYPVMGLVPDKSGEFETAHSYSSAGRYSITGICDLDLIPKPVKHTRTVWFNVYRGFGGLNLSDYSTREHADDAANSSRIACIERTIEFVEGEGLAAPGEGGRGERV
jgi:hypothetical protein